MAIAVLDIDFEDMPEWVDGLQSYVGALVLVRLNGRPVGQAVLRVEAGRVHLRRDFLYAADSGFWEAWLRRHVGVGNDDRSPAHSSPPATVAVCTRDRPDDLRRCLAALARLPADGQEILVVDNCPTIAETRHIVENCPSVRYVREDRPGLNAARNRALQEARHEWVAFCDDDAAPDPGWLRALTRHFSDPSVMCVTGLTMPLELETPAQEYFQRAGGLGRGFKRVVFEGGRHDPLSAWCAGAGANMALRRSVTGKVGPFDERVDAGTPVGGGGDTDMFRRILAAGHRIVYEPAALNWHRHRTEWRDLCHQLEGYESARFAMLLTSLVADHELEALRHAREWVRKEVPKLVRALLHLPGATPAELAIARLRGAAAGPWVFLYSHLVRARRGWRT